MNGILIAAAVVGGVGLVLGIILGIADKFLQVEVDPRIEKVLSMLPGYNCGACGKPGCAGLAEAMIVEGAKPELCKPCKPDVRKEIEKFLKEQAEAK